MERVGSGGGRCACDEEVLGGCGGRTAEDHSFRGQFHLAFAVTRGLEGEPWLGVLLKKTPRKKRDIGRNLHVKVSREAHMIDSWDLRSLIRRKERVIMYDGTTQLTFDSQTDSFIIATTHCSLLPTPSRPSSQTSAPV